VTWVIVPDAQFRLVEEGSLRWFQSSPQSRRGFCGQCGSSLFFRSTLCPGEIHLARAALFADPDRAPQYNCFTDEIVQWGKMHESLVPLAADHPELKKYRAIAPPGRRD
jgi:hypothetical protein